MLGIVHVGYDALDITIGVFKLQTPELPELIHSEFCESLHQAISILKSIIAKDPIVIIYACPTEILEDTYGLEIESVKGFAKAECFLANSLVRSYLDPTVLPQLPDGSVLSETACLAKAFLTSYQTKLAQYSQVAHLHLAENQIDLFMYNRSKLAHYSREILDKDDRSSYEMSLNLLLSDEQELWQLSHLELLVVSGASKWVTSTKFNLIESNFHSDIIEPFNISNLYIENTPTPASSSDSNFDQHKSAVSILLAGAVHSYIHNHGADFRNILKPKLSEVPNNSIAKKLGSILKLNSVVSEIPIKKIGMVGLLGGFISLFLIISLQYIFYHRRESHLNLQLIIENKRAETNRALKSEAENFKKYLELINARIETINRLRKVQGINYQISNNVRWQVPPGIVLTLLKIEGRNITISGYVSVTNAVEAQSMQNSRTTQLTDQASIDVADAVTTFVRNLEGSGNLYSNIQSTYKRISLDKSEFTITCNYQGDVVVEPIFSQPIPPLVTQTVGQK